MSNERDTDTDTWFIVKATDPYTNGGKGGGWVNMKKKEKKKEDNKTHS